MVQFSGVRPQGPERLPILYAPKGERMEEIVKKVLMMLLGCGLVVGLSLPALAVSSVELHKLLASDGAADDWYGRSVCISGDTAVIGACYEDDNGFNSGSAYVFRFNRSSWVQEAKLLASDGAANDWFGCSVGISGDTAVIGALYDDDKSNASGSAYVFRFNGSSWVQEAKLLASDGAAGDYFGYSVSISGDTTIIGAHYDDDNDSDSGSAYIFRFNGSSWVQEAKLLASDGAVIDYFGRSVSISGDTAVIGANGNDENGYNSGSAYLYDFSDPCNITETKLTATDAAAGDYFGYSVAISGTTAIVGALGDDDAGDHSGSAYLFGFCPFPPVGDINLDCRVNLRDFACFGSYWLETACGLCGGTDLTGNGDVDGYDLQRFTDNWLVDCIFEPSDPACLAP
jgi:hypothetical protein